MGDPFVLGREAGPLRSRRNCREGQTTRGKPHDVLEVARSADCGIGGLGHHRQRIACMRNVSIPARTWAQGRRAARFARIEEAYEILPDGQWRSKIRRRARCLDNPTARHCRSETARGPHRTPGAEATSLCATRMKALPKRRATYSACLIGSAPIVVLISFPVCSPSPGIQILTSMAAADIHLVKLL